MMREIFMEGGTVCVCIRQRFSFVVHLLIMDIPKSVSWIFTGTIFFSEYTRIG